MRTILTLVAVALLFGCSSAGKSKGQKKLDKLTSAIDNHVGLIRKFQEQLTGTLKEHDAIVDNRDGDLIGHYKYFVRNLDKLEKRRVELRAQSEEVQAASRPYFDEWKASLETISDAELRSQSQDRMEKTMARYQQVSSSTEDAKKAYALMATKLRDHQVVWSNELNKESAPALAKDSREVKALADRVMAGSNAVISAARAYNESVSMRTK